MDPNALHLWVHCNSCVRQVRDDPKLVMYFTNCGHFFCQHCVQKSTSPKCLACDVQNVRTMVLGPDIPPEMLVMFQNSIKLPGMLHRAMEFQQGHIRQTLHLYRMKADKMTKQVRSLMEECKMYKQKSHQVDQECIEIQQDINRMLENRKRREASSMNFPGQGVFPHSGHQSSNMVPTSTWTRPNRSHTPGFSGMEVNVFNPKTPDAFKTGKMMLSNAVTLQAMQQGPSPGHVRNLFSPKGQEDTDQHAQRRLSSGSGGRGNKTGFGLCAQGQSPFSPISRGFGGIP